MPASVGPYFNIDLCCRPESNCCWVYSRSSAKWRLITRDSIGGWRLRTFQKEMILRLRTNSRSVSVTRLIVEQRNAVQISATQISLKFLNFQLKCCSVSIQFGYLFQLQELEIENSLVRRDLTNLRKAVAETVPDRSAEELMSESLLNIITSSHLKSHGHRILLNWN